MAIFEDGTGDVPTRPLSARQARDIYALVFLVLGATGLAVAAFAVDWRMGLAVIAACFITCGVVLGSDR